MSKFLHGLAHVGIAVLNIAAVSSGFVPAKYAPIAIAVQGLAQTILGMVNHSAQQPK